MDIEQRKHMNIIDGLNLLCQLFYQRAMECDAQGLTYTGHMYREWAVEVKEQIQDLETQYAGV